MVWTLTPLHMPSAVMMAAFLPREMPCARTKAVSGPGQAVKEIDAPTNQRSVEVMKLGLFPSSGQFVKFLGAQDLGPIVKEGGDAFIGVV